MDISIFDFETAAERGFWACLPHPDTQEETDIELNLYGMDSKIYESAAIDYQREVKQIGDVDKDCSTEERMQKDSEKLSAECRFLARCTKGWRGLQENENELAFSFEECARVYKRYKGLREFADRCIVSRKRLFTKTREG